MSAHHGAHRRPAWWHTDRARARAREIGDVVDELAQLGALVIAGLVVVGLDALVVMAIWPLAPHVAAGMFAAVLIAVAGVVVALRRRPPKGGRR